MEHGSLGVGGDGMFRGWVDRGCLGRVWMWRQSLGVYEEGVLVGVCVWRGYLGVCVHILSALLLFSTSYLQLVVPNSHSFNLLALSLTQQSINAINQLSKQLSQLLGFYPNYLPFVVWFSLKNSLYCFL